jgi:hypothetical protein
LPVWRTSNGRDFLNIYVINSFLMKEEDVSRFAKKKTKKQGLIFGPFYQVAF